MKHIAILGNGISGITAARHIRKCSDFRITVISSESPYFFSRTALMYVYMGHMRFEHTQPYEHTFWDKNRITLLQEHAEQVDFDQKRLHFRSGNTLDYDELILACGSTPNTFGWPGQDLDGVQGLYSKQDLERLEVWAPNHKACQRAVIVGGGLIGIELAEMLRSREIPVTFLVREPGFWNQVLPAEESQMINDHIREHHIDLRLNTTLKSIEDNGHGKCAAVITGDGERIPCDLVGLTAGVRPAVDFLKGGSLEIDRGILVNEFLETNIPGVYAIGDCAQMRNPAKGRKPIEAVWYTGRMMGEVVALTVTGNRTPYKPGIWFNSAKFMDVEYQTYGWISAKPVPGESQLFWQDKERKLALRAAYASADGRLLGIHALGIRLRHEVCDHWIRSATSIAEVIRSLHQAGFDPEFQHSPFPQIQNSFHQSLELQKQVQ